MNASEPKPGERVKDVRFTEDTIAVDLLDGRTIIDWRGDFRRLSLHPRRWVPRKDALFFAVSRARGRLGAIQAHLSETEADIVTAEDLQAAGINMNGAKPKEEIENNLPRFQGWEWVRGKPGRYGPPSKFVRVKSCIGAPVLALWFGEKTCH